MEERYQINPDTRFIQEIAGLGGDSLKKCFQCGTCSVVCSLSPDERAFPRKEMIWAQWGLKDRLMKDPDIWLCHHCSDCSTRCPRGAKPGDVLSAVREYSIINSTSPKFIGKALSSPKLLPLMMVIPALLLFIYLWFTGTRTFPTGEISPEALVPGLYTYIGMGVLFLFMIIMFVNGVSRLLKGMSESEINFRTANSEGSWSKSLPSLLGELLAHSRFDKCGVNRISRYTHLAIFYGCLFLLLATALSAIFNHFLGIYSPHPLTSPVKIAGNLGALLVMIGMFIVIYRRLSRSESLGKTAYADWFLVWILFFTALSGIATEVIRISALAAATYWIYLVHLWLMFTFFLYLPFSKGAHMIYRSVAIIYATRIGRKSQVIAKPVVEV